MGSCQLWTFFYLTVLLHQSVSGDSVRLVGGHSRCQGQLQVQWTGQNWDEVAPDILKIPLSFGHRVCADLDCGPALTMEVKKVPRRKAVRLNPSDCKDTSLIDCFHLSPYHQEDSLQVNCSDSVRLVSGQTSCSGFLQIRNQSFDQSWTPVCEGALDSRGAEVLCRELGCGAPLLQGALSPLGQMFHCEGHESALLNCPRNQTSIDLGTCSGPALNLTCSGHGVRLVGGHSRCQGRLQVQWTGQNWTEVSPEIWVVPLRFGHRVCADLDCGPALSAEKEKVPERKIVHLNPYNCDDTSLIDCFSPSPNHHYDSLQVNCSDLLNVPEVSVSEGEWTPRTEGGVWVLKGADFQVKCSVEPQYPGGYFHLISPSFNLTLQAVNHSAHFLFTDASPSHKGNYTCVYHLQVLNHDFTSNSTLYICPGGDTGFDLL